MILTGENRSTPRKTYHSATLCTTNSTFDCPGFNKAVSKNRKAHLYLQRSYWSGHAVAKLAEALRYKTGGRGFDSPWGH